MTDTAATATIDDKAEEYDTANEDNNDKGKDDEQKDVEQGEGDGEAKEDTAMEETEAPEQEADGAVEGGEEVAGAGADASKEQEEDVLGSIEADLRKYNARKDPGLIESDLLKFNERKTPEEGKEKEKEQPKRKKRKTKKQIKEEQEAQEQQKKMNLQMQQQASRMQQMNMQMNMNMQRQAMSMAAQQQQQMMAMNNPMAMMNNNMMNMGMGNPMAMTMMMNNNMMNMNPMATMSMMNPMAAMPTSRPPPPPFKPYNSIVNGKVADNQKKLAIKSEDQNAKPPARKKPPSEPRGPRGNYNKPDLDEDEQRLRDSLLEGAALQLLKAQALNGGRLPGGYMKEILADLRKNPLTVDARRDTVYNAVRKIPQHLRDQFVKFHEAAAGNTKKEEDSSPKKRGRPKGTPKPHNQENYDDALEWASLQLMEKMQEAKNNGVKLANHTAKSIAKEAKKKFDLSTDISADTIRSRAKRNNPTGRMSSPMEEVEPVLVQLCIEANEMGEPLDKKNFLALANSLIKGTPTEEKVRKFKETCKHDGEAELGVKYYQQFMKRHKATILAGGKKQEQEATAASLGSPKQGQQGVAAMPPSVPAMDTSGCAVTAVLLEADPQKSDSYVRKFLPMLLEADISDFDTLSLATKEDLKNAGVSIGGALNIYNTVQRMKAEDANSSDVGLL